MAKYRAYFDTSGIGMEYEGVSCKNLYEMVKYDLRWSLTHSDIPCSKYPFERVYFYKEESWGWSYQFIMTARRNEFLGKHITLIGPSNKWGIIWKEKQA